MKNFHLKVSAFVVAASLFIVSCDKKTAPEKQLEKTDIVHHVMSAEEQEKLTPEIIVKDLKEGNDRFTKNELTERNHSEQVIKAAQGQYPKAFVLSCIDSRVPVEDVFDQGIGDLFVGRVAGNFANVDLLGSIEYACKVSGTKLVIILGHESCGAIKGAIDDVKLGNLTSMLNNIKPAVEMTKDFKGDKTSKNKGFVHEVALNNVKHTVNYIRKNSPVLKEMEDKGEVKIVGAMYNFSDGKVVYLN